jgi:hypothetical protein
MAKSDGPIYKQNTQSAVHARKALRDFLWDSAGETIAETGSAALESQIASIICALYHYANRTEVDLNHVEAQARARHRREQGAESAELLVALGLPVEESNGAS